MFKGFNLKVNGTAEVLFRKHSTMGSAFMAKEWPKLKPDLSALVSKDIIDGKKTMQDWFASVDANVFISHSHADELLAAGLAGYLQRELGLRPFVDSLVWNNASDLLWTFDNLHCKPTGSSTFAYESRNYSTSHVHMMLASSLSEAIDRCECIIFLNTPSSIQVSDAKSNAEEMTASPWIYHELNTSRLIEKRKPDRPMSRIRASTEAIALDKGHLPTIRYPAPLDHLAKLAGSDILQWGESASRMGAYGAQTLDVLYRSHS